MIFERKYSPLRTLISNYLATLIKSAVRLWWSPMQTRPIQIFIRKFPRSYFFAYRWVMSLDAESVSVGGNKRNSTKDHNENEQRGKALWVKLLRLSKLLETVTMPSDRRAMNVSKESNIEPHSSRNTWFRSVTHTVTTTASNSNIS